MVYNIDMHQLNFKNKNLKLLNEIPLKKIIFLAMNA
jgi:hypothetical protein